MRAIVKACGSIAIVKACGSIKRVVLGHDSKKWYAIRCQMPGCNYASINVKRRLLKKDHW